MPLRSIPPVTNTGRLRSADPQRFRTRPREQVHPKVDDPYGAGMAPPVIDAVQYKRERRKPMRCRTCRGANINGAEEHDGDWYVYCVVCDSRQPALLA